MTSNLPGFFMIRFERSLDPWRPLNATYESWLPWFMDICKFLRISKFWTKPNFSFDTFKKIDNLGFFKYQALLFVKSLVDADLTLTSGWPQALKMRWPLRLFFCNGEISLLDAQEPQEWNFRIPRFFFDFQ